MTERVVITRRLPAAVERQLRARFDVQLNENDLPMDLDALRAAVADARVLVPTVTDRIDASVIAAAGPQLGLIASFGVGFDHVDVAAARARGIAVTNTPGVLTDATADLALLLILAVTRRAFEGARLLAAGRFTGWTPTFHLGVSLGEKKLGIVGMGRIGRAVALRARAFGLSVGYHNRRRASLEVERELGASFEPDLDALLAESDIVTLHCPATPATRHLLSRERLRRMKPSAFLINTARGEVVDEEALADALERGQLAGAGLDVYEREPTVTPKLLGLPNVVLLPHLGSATQEARNAMGEKVMANIQAFFAGEPLPDRVPE